MASANIKRRTPDTVNLPPKTADDGMATEITRLVSSLLYTIPYDTQAELPCTFYHVGRYFNHYSSNVSSTRWARVRSEPLTLATALCLVKTRDT
jgi:hypothetical protein